MEIAISPELSTKTLKKMEGTQGHFPKPSKPLELSRSTIGTMSADL
jgi:hypothetical protein